MSGIMQGRTLKEIRDELQQLMLEQLESLKMQTFGGLSEEELRAQDERLKRIREVSADFLSALKDGSIDSDGGIV
jgi:nucleotidyltransferase/DNA polymerase involved in DNA repair